jgi:UDP-N-acetylglucosamine diphosphorylase/glucosamine-1-phosphate N-acetyltransferase
MTEKHHIILFEDEKARSRSFKPLSYNRAVSELRTGLFTQVERLRQHNLHLHTTAELASVLREIYPKFTVNNPPKGVPTILLNARNKDIASALALIESSDKEHTHIGDANGDIVAAKNVKGLPDAKLDIFRKGEPFTLPPLESSGLSLFGSLWDMIHFNPQAIEIDIRNNKDLKNFNSKNFPGVFWMNEEQLFIGKNVSIAPSVVLDATKGSIVIDDGVTIQPHVSITGPVFIGKNSLIKAGAKIFGGTSIGHFSKIGGEIENSIVQGYSNKQHDGYLGHSYIGEWCNLGAGTNTSDLRNDYGNISVKIEGEVIDTGLMFVGLLMGDHSKSAIGTQFNTGTAVGVHCNVFGAGFPPKWIPNFSWGGAQKIMKQDKEKALEVAKIVMERRGKKLTEIEADYYRSL